MMPVVSDYWIVPLVGGVKYDGVVYAAGSGSSIESASVPEPSTLMLLGIGAISLLGYRKASLTGATLMLRKTKCATTLITFLIVSFASSLVSAQTVVIPHTDRGWYSETGLNDPTNLNYFVGDLSGSCTHCPADHRNFFVFDLASVNQPIASAKLALFVPSEPPPGPGYSSPDPSETYELHDIVTSIAALLDGTGGVAAHTDLGSGVVYGSRTMTAADMGSVVEITLNSAAIAALDAATGLIGIGGSLTTLDGLANDEYTFGGTSVFGLETETTELRITLVPEPSTLLLLGIGAISLLGFRNLRPSDKVFLIK